MKYFPRNIFSSPSQSRFWMNRWIYHISRDTEKGRKNTKSISPIIIIWFGFLDFLELSLPFCWSFIHETCKSEKYDHKYSLPLLLSLLKYLIILHVIYFYWWRSQKYVRRISLHDWPSTRRFHHILRYYMQMERFEIDRRYQDEENIELYVT